MSSDFANDTTPRKAVILSRVSTERQNKLSPRAQVDRGKWFCKAQGWEVVATYCEVGSGRKSSRDGLKLAFEKACEVKGVLVTYDSSRLFRNILFAKQLLKKLEASGAHYATVSDGVNTMNTGAGAKMILNCMMMIAEYQSDQTSEKVALSNRLTVQRLGYRTNGPQPSGLKLGPDRKRVLCEEEVAVLEAVERVMQDRYVNKSFGKYVRAAKLLNEEGVPTIGEVRARRNNRENRMGSGKWTKIAVRNATIQYKWLVKKGFLGVTV